MLRKTNKQKTTPIYAGPRNKSLATQHLEYIAYALLDKDSKIAFCHREDFLVEINGLSFNLSAILEARPDFEQLHFNTQQLDAFYNNHGTYIPSGFKQAAQSLHAAEKSALYTWTTSAYVPMQALLQGKFNDRSWKFLFLSICIASHALNKPLTNKEFCPQTLLRGESIEQNEARNLVPDQTNLFMEKGFMAFSYNNKETLFGSYPVQIRIDQEQSLTPIGKPIADYSKRPNEHEVLIPPNTEFLFTEHAQYWAAIPVRSVHADASYPHQFDSATLDQITLAKIKLLVNSVYQSLLQQKKYHTHTHLRRFFFDKLDNDQELWCYSRAIVETRQLLSAFTKIETQYDLSLLKHDINRTITEIKFVLAEHPEIDAAHTHVHHNLRLCMNELDQIKRHIPAAQHVDDNQLNYKK